MNAVSTPRLFALSLSIISLAACGDGSRRRQCRRCVRADDDPRAKSRHRRRPRRSRCCCLPILDGLTVRRLGLIRFGVERPEVDGLLLNSDVELEDDEFVFTPPDIPQGDVTHVEASFTALDAPLSEANLARAAAAASGAEGCYPIEDQDDFVGAPLDAVGSPIFAGEVLTVSRTSGSWFELWGLDDASEDFFYEVRGDRSIHFGSELVHFGTDGDVQPGTTIDIPGSTFPAFTGVEVPAMMSLSDVTESGQGMRWQAGTDLEMPVAIDVRFHDYLTLVPSTEEDVDDFGGVSTSDGYYAVESLVEAPADVRCMTRDIGRFEYPDTLKKTIEDFRAAGFAVSSRILPPPPPPPPLVQTSKRAMASDTASLETTVT